MAAPTGTVTFLFTDIEGSTRLWDEHPETMRGALARHDHLLRTAIEAHDGYVFKTVGDAFCASFSEAGKAIRAALAIQATLAEEPWPVETQIRVRMALHTAEATFEGGDYFGRPLNRVARLLSTGHGGQTLLSESTHSLIRESAPAEAELTDLGTHLLRDLLQPERIFQISALASKFPPLKSLVAWPNNLPAQLTSFVGRDAELEEVGELLLRHRLVTLTGTAGLGKTRLALQLTAGLADSFPDGGWLVELAPLRESVEIPSALRRILGFKEAKGDADPLAELVEYLKSGRRLLVMDNAEHVLEPTRHLVESLLRSCPDLRVVATSREPLGIEGECVWRVPPLESPKNGTHDRSPALQLFLERAELARPGLVLAPGDAAEVGEICRRLDGIPLALELAASRLRVLEPRQIRERLDRMFSVIDSGSRGKRTLHAALEWSYDSLDEPGQLLFRRLGAFRMSWSIEEAEAVAGFGELDPKEVLEALGDLLDRSLLVRVEGGRYRYLEPVRQFAREALEATAEAPELRARHLEWCRELTGTLTTEILGPTAQQALTHFDAVHPECLAALQSAAEDASLLDPGCDLAANCVKYWAQRGHIGVGSALLKRLLETQNVPDSRARGRAWGSLAVCKWYSAEFDAALQASQSGLAVARELGLVDMQGSLSDNRAVLLFSMGRIDEAREQAESALRFDREHGLQVGVAAVGGLLGQILVASGEFEEARACLEESSRAFQELGNLHGWSVANNNLGEAHRSLGNLEEARKAFSDCARFRRSIGDRQGEIWSLEAFARLAGDEAHPAEALRLLACADHARQEMGFQRNTSEAAQCDALRANASSLLSPNDASAAIAEGTASVPGMALERLLGD